MTTPALVTPFIAIAVAAACTPIPPALAGMPAPDPAVAAAVHRIVAMPESPAAAFERLLGARTPAPSAAVVRDEADAMQAAFRAVLWRTPAPVATATRREVRP